MHFQARFDAAYAFGAYAGNLRKLIHLFKYQRMRTLSRPLGSLLAKIAPDPDAGEHFDWVVPVPMHWTRRWQRGFNQTEDLGRVLAKRVGAEFSNAIVRSRRTAAQAGLTGEARRQNLIGVFRPARRAAITGKRILLVDDVFTTGATAGACARALKDAGAQTVVLLTLARVDRRSTDAEAILTGDF